MVGRYYWTFLYNRKPYRWALQTTSWGSSSSSNYGTVPDRYYFPAGWGPLPFIVRNFLNLVFLQSWIGRKCPVAWPPRSCDLTPMDFSVWGIVRDLVFTEPPADIELMKVMIQEAFATFTPDLCAKICRNVKLRASVCFDQDGNQFEHLFT